MATLCIRTITVGTPSNFEMSKLNNIAKGTRYINPRVISVVLRAQQDWHDPTSSEGWLEDLMTNDLRLGSSEALSPTFTAHFNSMPETRPWTLMTSSPQLIKPEPWRSYTAHIEGNPHEDHPPSDYSVPELAHDWEECLAIWFESDLGEPVTEDSCNWWTSCCTVPITCVPNTNNWTLGLSFSRMQH